MATEDDRDGSPDTSSPEVPVPARRKKKAAAKKSAKRPATRKQSARSTVSAADTGSGETPGPAATTPPPTETRSMPEEHAAPAAESTPPLRPPGRAEEGFSPGAAVAAWGPVALLAILIVVFRVGGESASAGALPAIPGSAIQGHTSSDTASGSAGLALPPLTLPGSDKLIEELNANPWHLQGPGERPAPPSPGAGAPPAPPVASASPAAGSTAPPMPPGGRSWGPPDPAYGYWGAPPTGYGRSMPYGPMYGAPSGAQSDPYWWAQGAGAAPPEPPRPPKD